MNIASLSPRTTAYRLGIAAVVLALSGLWAAPSHAAPVTHSFSFTASGFINLRGATPKPVDPVIGRFTVTFDPSVDRFNQTTDLVLNSLNLPTPSFGIGFTYRTDRDLLIVGGLIFDVDGLLTGDDFFVVIEGPATSSPTLFQVGYTLESHPTNVWSSFTGSVTRDGDLPPDPPANVPEPNALALALTAALAAGLQRRRRQVGSAATTQVR